MKTSPKPVRAFSVFVILFQAAMTMPLGSCGGLDHGELACVRASSSAEFAATAAHDMVRFADIAEEQAEATVEYASDGDCNEASTCADNACDYAGLACSFARSADEACDEAIDARCEDTVYADAACADADDAEDSCADVADACDEAEDAYNAACR